MRGAAVLGLLGTALAVTGCGDQSAGQREDSRSHLPRAELGPTQPTRVFPKVGGYQMIRPPIAIAYGTHAPFRGYQVFFRMNRQLPLTRGGAPRAWALFGEGPIYSGQGGGGGD